MYTNLTNILFLLILVWGCSANQTQTDDYRAVAKLVSSHLKSIKYNIEKRQVASNLLPLVEKGIYALDSLGNHEEYIQLLSKKIDSLRVMLMEPDYPFDQREADYLQKYFQINQAIKSETLSSIQELISINQIVNLLAKFENAPIVRSPYKVKPYILDTLLLTKGRNHKVPFVVFQSLNGKGKLPSTIDYPLVFQSKYVEIDTRGTLPTFFKKPLQVEIKHFATDEPYAIKDTIVIQLVQ